MENLSKILEMSDIVVIDALPYYDRGYDEPGVREAEFEKFIF